jgi:hypothetical protein
VIAESVHETFEEMWREITGGHVVPRRAFGDREAFVDAWVERCAAWYAEHEADVDFDWFAASARPVLLELAGATP